MAGLLQGSHWQALSIPPVTTHLPYAFIPGNEFYHPSDGWLLLERSVVFDSWISWRHVLPNALQDCRRMTPRVNQAILALAAALHEIHQRLPDYRDLGESPFKVSRWWDPDGGYPWDTGSTCLFQISGYTSDEFIAYQSPQSSNGVSLQPASDSQIKAVVIQSPASGLDIPDPDVERPPKPEPRRRRRSPPARTPDCGQPAASLEP
jgi:hypothetical protein